MCHKAGVCKHVQLSTTASVLNAQSLVLFLSTAVQRQASYKHKNGTGIPAVQLGLLTLLGLKFIRTLFKKSTLSYCHTDIISALHRLTNHSIQFRQITTLDCENHIKINGKGAVLQIGRSLVRSQVVSLEFFIDIILPIALWPWGQLSL